MQAKKIFLALFVISLVSFFPLVYFFHDTYIYEASLHLGMFSLAMYFLWQKDLKSTLKYIGIPGNIKKNIVYTVVGFALIFLVLPILAAVLYYYGLNDQQAITDIVIDLPLYIVLMAIVIAPLTEELLFRVLFITKIQEYTKSAALAIIVSSLVFSAFHVSYGSVVEIVGVFVVGLIFGFVYWQSRSIIPPLFIHLVYNFLSIMVMRGFI